jgi:hypothetical protein
MAASHVFWVFKESGRSPYIWSRSAVKPQQITKQTKESLHPPPGGIQTHVLVFQRKKKGST